MRRIYSFDVFDTCLCRICGEPNLVFDVLSLKMQKALGDSCTEQFRQSFVAARIAAEGKNLEEIYNNVTRHLPLPCSVKQMIELEQETEKEMLVPIVATQRLVKSLREKGDIIFISDMYLSSAFIREQLVKHGFFEEGDRLFVSEERQAWKHDGSLFRLIHEREDIPYCRWHHYGDNRISDVIVPRRLGIHTHYIHYNYLPYEEHWRQIPILQYQYPSILAGVARAVRLSSDAPQDQKSFVCDISIPLMVNWVIYIMSDAQQRGIRRLYFCARDVHTQYLIASHLKPLFPSIDVRYLFISTQALQTDEKTLSSYFIQTGLLSQDTVALVDSNSSGNTVIKVNSLANTLHFQNVHGYYITGGILNKILTSSNNDILRLHFLNLNAYTECMTSSSVRRLSGIWIIFETMFSLNYHKRAIGYERHGDVMRPIFDFDYESGWYITGMNIRQAKQQNDYMSLAFCDAVVKTGLANYAKECVNNISVPTLVSYVDHPLKTYLHYPHKFIWSERRFVGSFWGKKKGTWKRGNLFYSLPSFFSTPLRIILSDANLRRHFNMLLSNLSGRE